MTTTRTLRPRRTSVLAAVVAAAALTIGGAASAQAATTPTALDTNGDTAPDAWAFDHNGSGLAEEIALDTDVSGYADTWVFDADEDSLMDYALSDTNGDGAPETDVPGSHLDTQWGAAPAAPISGPGVIGGGSWGGTGNATIDAIVNRSNERLIDIWLAPACNSSYNGCA